MKLKINNNYPAIFEINIYFLVSLKCFVYIINDLLIEFKTSFWSKANLVIIAHNASGQNVLYNISSYSFFLQNIK